MLSSRGGSTDPGGSATVVTRWPAVAARRFEMTAGRRRRAGAAAPADRSPRPAVCVLFLVRVGGRTPDTSWRRKLRAVKHVAEPDVLVDEGIGCSGRLIGAAISRVVVGFFVPAFLADRASLWRGRGRLGGDPSSPLR